MTPSAQSPVHIVGWSHSKFGKFDAIDAETLIANAVEAALLDAGLTADQVDAVVIGTFNGGFVNQDFPSSLAINAQPGLRFKPSLRVENACATGSEFVDGLVRAVGREHLKDVVGVLPGHLVVAVAGGLELLLIGHRRTLSG